MKICPNCKRTYDDDTLSFCLADGSVLTVSHDPNETQRIPAPRSTDAAPTEVLYPAPRRDNPPPLQPTIQAPQPPPFYSPKPPSRLPETRNRSTGLFIGVAVLFAIILGVGIIIGVLMSGKDGDTESKLPNTNTTPTSTPSVKPSVKPSITLIDLPGQEWEECETNVAEICGVWTRVSVGRWNGEWGSVEADLTVIVEGKDVTVTRRDSTSSLEAKYRGTLNADNTEVTGTVDWCCDSLGDRSGTWHAQISKSQR